MTTTTKTTIARAATGLAAALFAASLTGLAPPAAAQDAARVCQTRDVLLAQLERKYGEVPVAIGVADGRLIELLSAKDGLTWTIILTSPKGVSCLVAAGEGWRPLDPIVVGPDA